MGSVIIDNLKDNDVPHPNSATKDPHMHEDRGRVNEVAAMGGAACKNIVTMIAPVSKVLLAVCIPNLGRGFSAVPNIGVREMSYCGLV